MSEQFPPVLRESATFDRLTIQEIQRAAETGRNLRWRRLPEIGHHRPKAHRDRRQSQAQ